MAVNNNNNFKKLIIFLPKHNNIHYSLYCGKVQKKKNILVFFLINCVSFEAPRNVIGAIITSKKQLTNDLPNDFVVLLNNQIKYEIINVKFNGTMRVINYKETIIVEYNKEALIMHKPQGNGYFQSLTELLVKENKNHVSNISHVPGLTKVITIVHQFCRDNEFLFKFSAVTTHFKNTINCLNWVFGGNCTEVDFKVQLGNYMSAFFIDILFGIIVINVISMYSISSDTFSEYFIWVAEYFIQWLTNLLNWLAGSPAGFKLNHVFNLILCHFFRYNTSVWAVFIGFISPILPIVFNMFKLLGLLGITFQAAILADLLSLVSFHIYCIYSYAARLYNIQLSGLLALFRLFVGKKWNPLREKVDSCNYSAEQLCVGTIAFTFLLFLMPTTLVYYVVFTSTRLLIVMIGTILTRIRCYFHAIPYYSTFLWLRNSRMICMEVKIECADLEGLPLHVTAKSIPMSYRKTIEKFIPECLEIQGFFDLDVTQLLTSVLRGHLLYPM